MNDSLQTPEQIYRAARACQLCKHQLPLCPRPIFQASQSARVVIVGQAPGIKAHDSDKPWNDASGDRLRDWLGLSRDTFYNSANIALVPMGFCYPGKGKSGDLPPRKECAPAWHEQIFSTMEIKVTLLVGQYAQHYYLHDKQTLTDRVKLWRQYLPKYYVLPHPSPRNNIWLKRNPWFEEQVVPAMRRSIAAAITACA